MKKLLLFLFVSISMCGQQSSVTATVYHAVVEQCNEDVQHTATNFKLDLENPYSHRILAVSRNLEAKGFVMNSKVYVSGTVKYDGVWIIRDRMNGRWVDRIDFLINKEMGLGKWCNVKIRKL